MWVEGLEFYFVLGLQSLEFIKSELNPRSSIYSVHNCETYLLLAFQVQWLKIQVAYMIKRENEHKKLA